MRRTIGFVHLVILSCVAGVGAQTPQPPKPGPEHKKLEYFVGKWTGSGEMKATPFGPAGKMSSSDTCTLFQGGFAVVCNSTGTAPTGPMKSIGIMGYNADQKVYTYYGLDNSGMIATTVAKGTVQGDTWTYTDEAPMAGKTIKSRFTLNIKSPTSYTFRWEMQGADNKWMPVMDGTSTKVTAAKATK
jgi:hypothetical protein